MTWRIPLHVPTYAVFGANTGVGKTIVSTLLTKAMAPNVTYIKPVSTGPLSDADYLHVDKYTKIKGQVLYQFDEPCSPHLAAGSDPPRDSIILQRLNELIAKSRDPVLIESAGGVHSPSPQGSSQLELYRPLRPPVILVADSNLGGISTTISSYESLRLHGYDIAAIIGFKADWGNLPYIQGRLPETRTIQIPAPPPRRDDPAEDEENMSVYYDVVSRSTLMNNIVMHLTDAHTARIARLDKMAQKALDKIWYPFTQHAHLEAAKVTTIDSAIADDFAVYNKTSKHLEPVFDGSASWWTQGLGHGNSELALEAAHAASRYGHVILPSAVNEPALALAETLLESVGSGWASRVYYSDNGSTGIEVALKMALKASRVRYSETKDSLKLGIIGLRDSYHGDTIGAMDASDQNIYNAEVDWYTTRGLFFSPPALKLRQGIWHVDMPTECASSATQFSDLTEVFDLRTRKTSGLAQVYTRWIESEIDQAVKSGRKFGALIFEPIVLGAGGMIFVDPLFQALLVQIVRRSTQLCPPSHESAWTGLPVITDEVFTGLFRLGHARASALLDIMPDISVNAKLLTGGAVPLATTLASEDIFNVFLKADKKDALLHGHSYTAHPIGTSVALKSLEQLDKLHSPDHTGYIARTEDWKRQPVSSVWSHEFVLKLSHHPKLDGVVCIGSVLAMTLRVEDGAGYGSMAATKVLDTLRQGTDDLGGVLARPLGNVLYFMASQVTSRETAGRVERLIELALSA